MGKRKRLVAEKRKEEKKFLSFAKLNNCPTSPRKMRLLADLIRGKKVDYALNILKLSKKEAAPRLRKLILSAVANWQAKNEGIRVEDAELFISKIQVDGGPFLKRLRPAPQGRAYRIRKRSNHVTVVIDSLTRLKMQKQTEMLSESNNEENENNQNNNVELNNN